MDDVGVLIAARSAAATIGRAVASALVQPAVSEVVVVDDGSADDTLAAAWRHDDGTGRLRLHSLGGNFGPATARNQGLALGRAAIVAVLDADDHFLPGRIAAVLAQAGTAWDFAADGMVMRRDGEAPGAGAAAGERRHDFRARVGGDMLTAEGFIAGNISRPGRPRQELGFIKPLIRRAFLERTGLRYNARLRLGEDFALYAEALLLGARFRLVPGCGYVAAWRDDSISARHDAADLRNLAEASLGLARLAGITPAQRAAVLLHARSVLRKADYQAALELKQQRRFLELAGFLSWNMRSVPYMVGQSIRARIS